MADITWVWGENFEFPPQSLANSEGILAVGGTVSPITLRRAYRSGIFPWPVEPTFPVLWFCPDERFVLELNELHISRSLRRSIRRDGFEVRFDTDFDAVVDACAGPREGAGGTWIDERIAPAYGMLHRAGRHDNVSAHSVETWQNGKLVGGLYGVAVGNVFCGESMFHTVTNASKVALVGLVERMVERGFDLLDCQVHTEHLESLGAKDIARDRYLERLARGLGLECVLV